MAAQCMMEEIAALLTIRWTPANIWCTVGYIDWLWVFVSISTSHEQKFEKKLRRLIFFGAILRSPKRTDERTKGGAQSLFSAKVGDGNKRAFVCFQPPSGLAPHRRPLSSTPSLSIGLLNSWRASFQRAHWGALCGARINAGHVLAADYCKQAPQRRPRRWKSLTWAGCSPPASGWIWPRKSCQLPR